MKNLKLIVILSYLFWYSTTSFSQAQLKRWYIGNSEVDVQSIPVITALSGHPQPNSVYNAIYDPYDFNNHQALFYISDDIVYDRNNDAIAWMNHFFAPKPSEVVVVPNPANDGCTINKYYVIYCRHTPYIAPSPPWPGQTRAEELWALSIDMNTNGGLGSIDLNYPHQKVAYIPDAERGGLAVGKEINGERSLYFVGGTKPGTTPNPIITARIKHLKIGFGNIYTTGDYFAPSLSSSIDPMELDLSPDGTMLALASSGESGMPSDRYYIFNTTTLSWTTFDLGTDNQSGGRGVEFYKGINGNLKLLVTAGNDGIYVVDPANPINNQKISGSDPYGHSTLEMGYNGRIYAGSSTNIAAINVTADPPFFQNAFDINLVAPSYDVNGIFYRLPDQLDGEDYDNLFADAQRPLDLIIRDNADDVGVKPNPYRGGLWMSPDIWASKTNNPNIGDEPLEWSLTNPSFVFVRVTNKSCTTYTNSGNADQVFLHWTKASTTMPWPANWNGSPTMTCGTFTPQIGGEVQPTVSLPIPTLGPGQSAILTFPWMIPTNPQDFQNCFVGAEYSHYCLLARIESTQDPTGTVGISVHDNVQNENNWAWKNISVMNDVQGIVHNEECFSRDQQGGVVAVCNPYEFDEQYDLELKVDHNNLGIPIFKQAEITVTLDEITWQKWAAGGYLSDNIEIVREDCRQLRIKGSPASIRNLAYLPSEITLMALSFNFLADQVDLQPEFDYHLVQRRREDNAVIGGETYRIQKPSRYLFDADGGEDKTITSDESIELEAETIGEDAFYNWYNEAGELIYSGTTLIVDPDITTKYKLQIIAKNDGFTSYDEIIVHVKDYQIKTISPNPASTNLSVEYYVKEGASAYFLICPFNSSSSNNYLIDPTLINTSLNLSGMGTGSYYLRLIVNGEVKDEKSFVVVQ